MKLKRYIQLKYVAVSAIIFLAILVHASYINNGFVWFDHVHLERGITVFQPAQIYKAFLSRYAGTGFYRPVVNIVDSFDAAVFEKWAPGYHITNLLIYLAGIFTAFLFFGVYFELNKKESIIAAGVLAVHPLTWLPVGAISYREELLVTLFLLLAVYFHVKARISGKKTNFLFTPLFFALALFSKETAIVLFPALVVLWEVFNLREKRNTENMATLSGRAIFVFEFLVVVGYGVLHKMVIPENWKEQFISLRFSEAVGTRLWVLGHEILWLVSPLKPNLSDATRVVTLTDPVALLTVTVITLAVFTMIKAGIFSKYSKILLAVAIGFSPALNILPTPRLMSLHYAYLPMIFFAAFASFVYSQKRPHGFAHRRLFTGVFVLWLCLAAASTFAAGFEFNNDFLLFSTETAADTNFKEGHFYLGNYYLNSGENALAKQEFDLALRDTPGTLAFLNKLAVYVTYGELYFRESNFEGVDSMLIAAGREASPEFRLTLLYNRALIAYKQHDYKKIVSLLSGHDSDWANAQPLIFLADVLAEMGRLKEAVVTINKGLPLATLEQKIVIEQRLLEYRKK